MKYCGRTNANMLQQHLSLVSPPSVETLQGRVALGQKACSFLPVFLLHRAPGDLLSLVLFLALAEEETLPWGVGGGSFSCTQTSRGSPSVFCACQGLLESWDEKSFNSQASTCDACYCLSVVYLSQLLISPPSLF